MIDLHDAEHIAGVKSSEAMELATEHAELALHVENADEANAMLKEIQRQLKLLDGKRKELKAPSLEAGRRIDAFFKPPIERLTLAKAALKQYIQKELAAQREAQRKALEEAETNTEVGEALALPVVQAKTRRVRRIRVAEVDKIPRACMMPDMTEITARVDAGDVPPGIEVVWEDVVTA